MPLVEVQLPIVDTALPADVRNFVREGMRRIRRFQRTSRTFAFVPSDFERVYAALQLITSSSIAPGQRLCEWGSGFGVVAGTAAMLGLDAWGIEIDEDLVEAARELAADFDLPVEFIHGSFIPQGGADLVDSEGVSSWLIPDEGVAYEEIGLDPDDFDLVFAYPWPDEEGVVDRLFERYASPGSVLLTFHGSDDLRLRRKSAHRTNRRKSGVRR
jgi:hypothetical protein